MDKQTYDGNQERVKMAMRMMQSVDRLQWHVLQARQAELTYASNETVDPKDFDTLRSKLWDVEHEVARLLARYSGVTVTTHEWDLDMMTAFGSIAECERYEVVMNGTAIVAKPNVGVSLGQLLVRIHQVAETCPRKLNFAATLTDKFVVISKRED